LPSKPVTSFAHFGFDEQLMKAIRKLEYVQPTPIQAQAVPVALNGRDIIGIAKTGSGKTAAFIWPMLVHIMDQPELKPGDGPIGLILVPTRELAQQIYTEAKRFCKAYGIEVVCAYGGGSKYEQSKDLEAGAEIVVATPVSLIL
jgi:ATP-dependent RNA helicase DDX42